MKFRVVNGKLGFVDMPAFYYGRDRRLNKNFHIRTVNM